MTDLRLCCTFFFFLMIRRPPRSTLDRSSAASDVYKRQVQLQEQAKRFGSDIRDGWATKVDFSGDIHKVWINDTIAVSYTHLRAHETVLDLVCRLLLEKKNKQKKKTIKIIEEKQHKT